MNSKVQHPFCLFLQLCAKRDFWLSRYRKVQVRRLPVVKRLARKFCLANPSATSQNSETRLLKREFARFSQLSQLNFSTKEPHISPLACKFFWKQPEQLVKTTSSFSPRNRAAILKPGAVAPG
jgi:hypothetical protein